MTDDSTDTPDRFRELQGWDAWQYSARPLSAIFLWLANASLIISCAARASSGSTSVPRWLWDGPTRPDPLDSYQEGQVRYQVIDGLLISGFITGR